MKRLLALTAALLLAFSLTGCADQVDLSQYPWDLVEYTGTLEHTEADISIRPVEGSVSSESAEFLLENNGDTDFEYAQNFKVYLKANNKLYQVPYRENLGWDALIYTLPAHDSVTEFCNWEGVFGSLPSGQYLFVKTELNADYCLVCEFEVP